jgi:hypothetical protein
MQLLTEELRAEIPPLYAQENNYTALLLKDLSQ